MVIVHVRCSGIKSGLVIAGSRVPVLVIAGSRVPVLFIAGSRVPVLVIAGSLSGVPVVVVMWGRTSWWCSGCG